MGQHTITPKISIWHQSQPHSYPPPRNPNPNPNSYLLRAAAASPRGRALGPRLHRLESWVGPRCGWGSRSDGSDTLVPQATVVARGADTWAATKQRRLGFPSHHRHHATSGSHLAIATTPPRVPISPPHRHRLVSHRSRRRKADEKGVSAQEERQGRGVSAEEEKNGEMEKKKECWPKKKRREKSSLFDFFMLAFCMIWVTVR